MVTYFEAILLGIVQGVTEWLPISSSGHLVLIQELIGASVLPSFDVLLHVGTLLVLLFFFRREIWDLAMATARLDRKALRMDLLIIIATIPTGLIGIFFRDFLESAFARMDYLAYGFLISAVWIFATRFRKEGKGHVAVLSALLIGVAQGISIIPSVSRSGATIATALILGIRKEESARFSFLIAIPAIAGAALLSLRDFTVMPNLPAAVAGTIASGIAGFFALKLLMATIKKDNFSVFAWYCLAIGLFSLWLAFFS